MPHVKTVGTRSLTSLLSAIPELPQACDPGHSFGNLPVRVSKVPVRTGSGGGVAPGSANSALHKSQTFRW